MEWSKTYESLISTLEKSSKVTSLDRQNVKEAATLAHAIVDIVESLDKIKNISSKLILDSKIDEDEIDNTLLEIGEELRHIIYHIKDTSYYKYLDI